MSLYEHLVEVEISTTRHELKRGTMAMRCDVLVVDGVRIAVDVLTLLTNPRRDSLMKFVRKDTVLEVTALQVLNLAGEIVPEMVLDAANALAADLAGEEPSNG